MIKVGNSPVNEATKTRSAKAADLKSIKVGDTVYHKDFKGPLIVTQIHKINSNYTKNFGISGIEVKASDGNKYDLWYDTETLRMQKKIGIGIDKLLIPVMNESVNFKGLVNLANKNEDVSKHKDLGKACWQYLFPRIKDMARDLDIEDTNIIVKAIYDWIKKHETMNESVGMTQSDWEEVRPEDYDEGQVEGYIKNFDDAAKALKCRAQDLVNITEDDGEAYNKIIRRIKKGDKGQKVKMPSVDGLSGLYILTNGCTVVTTNEWGYGTVFVKKSEVKKAMNESIESDF